jgi:glycosyltransferase involved in cell wall biosynthesis
MLKVIIDATPITPKPSGVGYYVSNLIIALHGLQEIHNFQLGVAYQPKFKNWLRQDLSFPPELSHYPNLCMLPLPVRLYNLLVASSFQPALTYFEQCLGNADIVHGTNYSVYPCKQSLKVMNIYDLSFIKYPQYTDTVVKAYHQQIKKNLQWTDLVLTISESSKQDIINYLEVEPNKVAVTPLASRYLSNQKQPPAVNYDFSRPYLLFVSTLEPRKNVITLINAFNYLKQRYKIEHNLILIGQKGWQYKPIFQAIASSPWFDCIHHLDYLSDELVALFYAKADVFVYPSYYEGFGLPVLEAMTLGAPVVTSNTSSLPEVAGDAAILVDPKDVISLAEAILRVVSDRNLRNELIIKGKAQAKLYSWERTAKETLNAYKTIQGNFSF